MIRRSSLRWPITLGVSLLALLTLLLIIWIISQASNKQWAMLIVGTVFIALVLIGVVLYLIITVNAVSLNRRQANFIDSVTHELKSPIASLKLYLQTLAMRQVTPEQQREFHRFMLEDVQRLDLLIDHLLTAAQLEHGLPAPEEDIPAEALLTACADETIKQYQLTSDQIRWEIEPCLLRGSRRDLEIVFGNLLDNAVKYGGQPPQVLVQVQLKSPRRALVRISDNGKGVAYELRRKIFQRFVRGGSELERTTKGTGLGLYLVKSLVGRLRGRIHVHGRGPWRGASFDVELPAAPLPPAVEPQTPAHNTVAAP